MPWESKILDQNCNSQSLYMKNTARARLFLLGGRLRKKAVSRLFDAMCLEIFCLNKIRIRYIIFIQYRSYRLPRMAIFAQRYRVSHICLGKWGNGYEINACSYTGVSIRWKAITYRSWFTRNRSLENIVRYHSSEMVLKILPANFHSLYNLPCMLMFIHAKTAHRWSIE